MRLCPCARDAADATGNTKAIAPVAEIKGIDFVGAELFDAAISLGAREHNLLTAARRAGSLTSDVSTELNEALTELADRGQRAGVVRADLAPADLPRMIAMLHSVLWTMDSGSDGWRRYVALMLDAISVGDRRTLPPAATLRFVPESGNWPMEGGV